MGKAIPKKTQECSYFVGNILVRVKDVFLQCYSPILSPLKLGHRGIFESTKSPSQIGKVP